MSVDTITESAQYLSFHLGEELFALDIAKVKEEKNANCDTDC